MVVKAKYDQKEYDNRGKLRTVFKAGCTYIAFKEDDNMYIVRDAWCRHTRFFQRAFENTFEVIRSETTNV
jgi:hypothetical protein